MVPITFLRIESSPPGRDAPPPIRATSVAPVSECVITRDISWVRNWVGPSSALRSASRSAATSCGRSFSCGCSAQSMARSTGSPKAARLATSTALGMASSRTREAASSGLRPVVSQYITAPSEYRSVQGPWLPLLWYCSKGAKPGLTILVMSWSALTRRAAPKSSSTGLPSARM